MININGELTAFIQEPRRKFDWWKVLGMVLCVLGAFIMVCVGFLVLGMI